MTNEEYWSIDIPGLTHEQGVRIRDELVVQTEWGVILIDPRSTMVRGFDRPTVELLMKCLEAGLEYAHLAHLDSAGALSMLEDCKSWLAQAHQ